MGFRKLPTVTGSNSNIVFLPTKLSLAGAATSIIFVATNTCCRDETRLLSRQKYTCRDKTSVVTKLCLSGLTTKKMSQPPRVFVATKLLSQQN